MDATHNNLFYFEFSVIDANALGISHDNFQRAIHATNETEFASFIDPTLLMNASHLEEIDEKIHHSLLHDKIQQLIIKYNIHATVQEIIDTPCFNQFTFPYIVTFDIYKCKH